EELSRLRRKLEKQRKVEVYADADQILQEEIKEYRVRPPGTCRDLPEPSGAFQNVLEPFGTCQDLSEHSRTFQDLPGPSGTFWDLPEPTWSFQGLLEPSRTFWEFLGSSKTFWNVLGAPGTFWDLPGPSRTFQGLLGPSRTFPKARLTCPCCNARKKDAVLTKCFHVFCFECVKSRYDTRQRKCPKCNAAFGAHDFHRVYIS
ncbi:hypothetical protein HGM15179_020561, partial [Zosterops borbonicus]